MRLEQFGMMQAGADQQYPLSRLTPREDFGSNPGALHMYSYAPPGLPPRAPLVVILHGCGQSAMAYDHGAGWSALADRFGFALLAPEQTRGNNFNRCFNWFQPGDASRGNGEAESIRQMIETAIADFAGDPARVYITGLSAGGAMTSAMLAAYPELFAGGAIIAGLPYGAASNVQEALTAMRAPPDRTPQSWGDAVRGASAHPGPWPRISVWHGDADNTVGVSNMEAVIAQWTDVHGLTRPPRQERKDNLLRRVWHDETRGPVIEAITLKGLGHGTPVKSGPGRDSYGEAGPFMLEAGISSSLRILDFFGLRQQDHAARPASEDATKAQDAPEQLVAGRVQAVIAKALKAAGLLVK